MENYVILGLIVLAIVLFKLVLSSASTKRKVLKDNLYSYAAKSFMMTRTESEFFLKLDHVVSERYHVFPQVHLSALLDRKVNVKLPLFRTPSSDVFCVYRGPWRRLEVTS